MLGLNHERVVVFEKMNMGNMARGASTLLVLLVLLGNTGCGGKRAAPDLLLGKWVVFHINRGGQIIGGPGFKGTEYEFRADGTMFASSAKGDSITTKYEHRGDTLVYVGEGVEERYHIDTLRADRLTLSADIDGIPTTVNMLKRKK